MTYRKGVSKLPRKKSVKVDSKVQEVLDYIGLDLKQVPDNLTEYTKINFRTVKGYNEKKYKQYRYINVSDIEILLSPTNRMDSIKEKYENAVPLCFYLDSNSEENILNHTTFLSMLNKISIADIEAVDEEQKELSSQIPFKVKFTGNYLWQIYYSEVSDKYFMLVPTEDCDYSTFFYLLKKKIENKKNSKIFVPISVVDYEGKILGRDEIKDLENYLWLFTKDYPLIYEVYDKLGEVTLNIIGEAEVYEKIKTLYKVTLSNPKEGAKFYKLLKALFIMQTEIPHYYQFTANINKDAELQLYLDKTNIKYEMLPEFIVEQYSKSVNLKNKALEDLEDFDTKLKELQKEADSLEKEFLAKEKQITTYLECKKTFFGKVKYFFKLGKASKIKNDKDDIEKKKEKNEKHQEKNKKEKFKLEERNYTLYELEQSYKELTEKEEQIKNKVMDINALKLKNKNLKKKIENASKYIEEINKHKKSIFEFWKYSNKDSVATLDEGEEEEINTKKLEKVFNYEDDFEKFGATADKFQRNKFTDGELESCYIATTDLLHIINRINLKVAENKEISDELKKIKLAKTKYEEGEDEEEEAFNIFGKIKQTSNKERTIGNKPHRESPRDKFAILEIEKGSKGIELKRNLEEVLKNLKTALKKNSLKEDMYVYKVVSTPLEFNTFETVSLNAEEELNQFLKTNKLNDKIYLYKIKLPQGMNFVAFTNIIFYDNKNMTLPVGMNLSSKMLIDLSKLDIKEKNKKRLNKLEFKDSEDDFSEIIVRNIEVNELK